MYKTMLRKTKLFKYLFTNNIKNRYQADMDQAEISRAYKKAAAKYVLKPI
jgi:hypothetical protein